MSLNEYNVESPPSVTLGFTSNIAQEAATNEESYKQGALWMPNLIGFFESGLNTMCYFR